MNIIEKYYTIATLSNAAYVDLQRADYSVSEQVRVHAVSQEVLADVLVDHVLGLNSRGRPGEIWHVDHAHHNDSTGLAATLFASDSGEQVLAIRGTEPQDGQFRLDLIQADIVEIGLIGLVLGQTASLFNLVQRLRAPAGVEAPQLALHTLTSEDYNVPPPAHPHVMIERLRAGLGGVEVREQRYLWLEPAEPVEGLGALAPGAPLTVTGHSLSGHLAALGLRLFPEVFTEAFTFNAPGFDPPGSLALTDEVIDLFRAFAPGAAAGFGPVEHRIHTLESEGSEPGDDVDAISGEATGAPPSPESL